LQALRPIFWDGAALNDIAVDVAEGIHAMNQQNALMMEKDLDMVTPI